MKCHCFCVSEVNQKAHGKPIFLSWFSFYLRRCHILSAKEFFMGGGKRDEGPRQNSK